MKTPTKRKPAALRWTPTRSPDGVLYCSPACGGKCTRHDHDKAQRAAEKVARTLGEGWVPVVWENLGWFSKVRHASGVEVYLPSHSRERFWATTTVGPQAHVERKTARGAVRALIAQLEDLAAHYAAGAEKLRGGWLR